MVNASIYTGSVPGLHGIVSNGWWDVKANRVMYCTEDKTAKGVGVSTDEEAMSPVNMLVTTIGDELKLATNFRSKVIGVALKDRGAILPAGHSADAAYWLNYKTFDWVSSTYYMKELPTWVKDLNAKKMAANYCKQGWKTLYPMTSYSQSAPDQTSYEGFPFGKVQKGFPYQLDQIKEDNYKVLGTTPFGNTFTLEMAKQALINEHLGEDQDTDLLTVSFSSPDHIGHTFGPNSVESEDNYLRLDQELGDFFRLLDQKIGKNQYTIFLSADHGVAHVDGFMKEHHLPSGRIEDKDWLKEINNLLAEKYKADNLILGWHNYQMSLNFPLIASKQLNEKEVRSTVIQFLVGKEGISRAFNLNELMLEPINSGIKEMVANGYYPGRSGDIQAIPLSGWYSSGGSAVSHSVWNPYDAHIPLLWYGWGIKKGKTNRETSMSDIAPTIASLLKIQMPSGTVGKPIGEILNTIK